MTNLDDCMAAWDRGYEAGVNAEREACAEKCEAWGSVRHNQAQWAAYRLAELIRERVKLVHRIAQIRAEVEGD